ncbi:MAG TPA: DUF6114 domain-containing protein [Candidatus Binatus sp.]|nr:DUF6114 domain-containing protein [Candidatus Binatus sp.]
MGQKTVLEYPNVPSILAIVGGALIVLVDVFLLAIAIAILPHLSYTNFTSPRGYTGSPGTLVSGFLTALGAFGLACGVIVTLSAVLVRLIPKQRQTWGILVLVFSILSFFGFGGFIAGAILGIVGGIMILRWKPPATPIPQ